MLCLFLQLENNQILGSPQVGARGRANVNGHTVLVSRAFWTLVRESECLLEIFVLMLNFLFL